MAKHLRLQPASLALALVLAALATGLAGCDVATSIAGGQTAQDRKDSTPRGVLRRYAYVVEVDTPKGIVTGRAVNGFRVDCHQSLAGPTCGTSERSEAAAVDLPDGRTLYALLTQRSEPEFVCCYHADAMAYDAKTKRNEFLPGHYPDLVMFDDERDPKSVHVVDGTKPFDKGYRVRRIYLTLTGKPLTREIPRRLPWLIDFDGRFNGGVGSNDGPDPERFGKFSFLENDDA